MGGVGREGAGVWNCGSGFWVRELSARQACEADLTLSSQSVAICSSDPVQPAVAHEGRGGFLEAWFWLQVWATLSRPAARRNWPCWPLPAPICASPPFTPCELGQESTPRELQQSQLQGLSRRRRGSWTGCWHSGPKVETTWGPKHASRRPHPAELPASDAAPQRRCPQPVLAAVWDCGAHLVLGEEEGCRGAPIQAHRPRLNTAKTLLSGTPSGCSAQAHTWLSFSPCSLGLGVTPRCSS